MSKMNWNRLGFFVLGTFLGGYVMGLVGALVGAGRKG